MVSPMQKHQIKKILMDELLHKLKEEHLEELRSTCSNLGLTLDELDPNSLKIFSEKKQSANTINNRLVHYEERRYAKTLKVASELSKIVDVSGNLADFYKELGIINYNSQKPSAKTSVIFESSSIFRKPADVIQYNIEKARQKFTKSVEVIKRIEGLRAAQRKKHEEIIRKAQERDQKTIKNMNKIEEKHGKHMNSTNLQRFKILQRKKEIQNELDKQMNDFGLRLDERMAKLSLANQSRIREMLDKQHEKIANRINYDYSRTVTEETQEKLQDKEIKAMIDELQNKIEKRLASYEDGLKRRSSSARETNKKVERIFSQSLSEYHRRNEDKLKKVIEKSLESDRKKSKKQEKYQKYSDEVRKSTRSSFIRNSKGLDSLSNMEVNRIKQIEDRVNEKSKLLNDLRYKFDKAVAEKRQKNSNRFEFHNLQYTKALESQARLRLKVLNKHQRICGIAEELKYQKFQLSISKRMDNFEIQKMRSAFTPSKSNRLGSKSKLERTV